MGSDIRKSVVLLLLAGTFGAVQAISFVLAILFQNFLNVSELALPTSNPAKRSLFLSTAALICFI
jgi:hypothetical protein